MKTEIKLWSKWVHKKHGIKAEVTAVVKNSVLDYVNLWDEPMLFCWNGTRRQFLRAWRPA